MVGFGGGSGFGGYVSWLPDADRLALKFSLACAAGGCARHLNLDFLLWPALAAAQLRRLNLSLGRFLQRGLVKFKPAVSLCSVQIRRSNSSGRFVGQKTKRQAFYKI